MRVENIAKNYINYVFFQSTKSWILLIKINRGLKTIYFIGIHDASNG